MSIASSSKLPAFDMHLTFQTELDDCLSLPPSDILQRLRAIQATRVPLQEARPGQSGSRDAKLSWSGPHLKWSRGSQLIRVLTYEEDVVQACWVHFDQGGSTSPGLSREGSEASARRKKRSSFIEPMSFSSSLAGDGNAIRRSSRFNNDDDSYQALVVILGSSINVHYPRLGYEYFLPKTFRLQRAYPASSGLFLQCMPESQEGSLGETAFPMLFYLGHHLDQLVPVPVRPRSSDHQPPPPLFSDPDETIVYVSQDEGSSKMADTNGPLLLVTVNTKIRRLSVFTYQMEGSTASQPPDLQGASRLPTANRKSSTSTVAASSSETASRPTLNRVNSASLSRVIHPRRSARLSGAASSRDASSSGTSKTSQGAGNARRRSSRYPSGPAELASMARIDESSLQPSTTMISGAPVLAGDAVEAEEMGQRVEGLAREGVAAGSSSTAAGNEESPTGTNGRRQQLNSMARTPFNPRRISVAQRLTSGTTTAPRQRPSRSLANETTDGGPVSTSFSNQVTAAAANLTKADEHDAFEEAVAPLRHAPETASSDYTDRPHPVLELVETVDLDLEGKDVDVQSLSAWTAHSKQGQTHLFLHLGDSLLRRVIGRDQSSVSSLGDSIPALGAAKTAGSDLLVLRPDQSLHLYLSATDVALQLHASVSQDELSLSSRPSARDVEIKTLRYTDNDIEIKTTAGEVHLVEINTGTLDRDVTQLFRALDRIDVNEAASLRKDWLDLMLSGSNYSEWDALRRVVLKLDEPSHSSPWQEMLRLAGSSSFKDHLPSLPPPSPQQEPHASSSTSLSENRHTTLLAILNAIAEDLRLDAALVGRSLPRFAELIVELASQHGQANELIDYWSSTLSSVFNRPAPETPSNIAAPRPVDVVEQLRKKTQGQASSLELNLNGSTTARVFSVDHEWNLSVMLASKSCEILDIATTSALMLERLVEQGSSFHQRLPWCVGQMIQDKMDRIKDDSLPDLSPEAHRLLGRQDLALQQVGSHSNSRLLHRRWPAAAMRTLPTTLRLDPLCAMLFPRDRRLQDVAEMLLTHRPNVIRAPSQGEKTDQENREAGIARLHNVAERVKATPIGRGMFLMLTRRFDPTQRWQTGRLNLRVLTRPAQLYGLPEPRPEAIEMEWPDFNNGCASALEMIVPKGSKVDSTWYFTQSTGERSSARHAGLLLGLGLTGQFATIGQVHTYRYLGNRDSLTSIGLLLGLAATFVGQCDPDVRALLACHVKAFLPPNSANLAHSTLVQSAALLGTGLLFLGSHVSHIAEALCEQIDAQEIETTNDQTYCRETYSCSAALGLGLVMLGKGRLMSSSSSSSSSSRDRRLLARLERCITARTSDDVFEEKGRQVKPTWRVDERITMAPAALAYGLIHLRSNNHAAANKIPLPQTQQDLDATRPAALLMLSLARNLILMQGIVPTADWLQSCVPPFLLQKSDSSTRAMARMNIETGACFALSLKSAGLADVEAKQLLLKMYSRFDAQAKTSSSLDYESQIRQTAARTAADMVALCLAVVMAGTGDVEVLKLLRIAHGSSNVKDPYGSHMANHMALGLLFLGGGRFTLGNSDSAIALLLIALYPRFPTSSLDNRAHLQAYRHFWLLAVQPRLLVCQDVDSREVTSIPVNVSVTSGEQSSSSPDTKELQISSPTPCHLPPLERVQSISVDSERYYKPSLGLVEGDHYFTLYVKRKSGQLSYEADAKGLQSSSDKASLTSWSPRVTLDGNDDDDKATPAARTARIISLQRALLDKPNARSFKIGIAADLSVGQRCMYLSALQMAKADDLADIDVFKLRDVALLSRILPKSSGRHFLDSSIAALKDLARYHLKTDQQIFHKYLLADNTSSASLLESCDYDLRLLRRVSNTLALLSPLALVETQKLCHSARQMLEMMKTSSGGELSVAQQALRDLLATVVVDKMKCPVQLDEALLDCVLQETIDIA